MKTLIILSFLLFSISSFACTDLSGEYFDEMDGTYFSMTQSGCESITYNFDEGPVERVIDGKEYLVNQYDITVEEGKVLATVKIFATNSFKGNKLITIDRAETSYTSGGVDKDQARTETYLNKSNDMIAVTSNSDGSKQTTIFKRVH